MVVKKIKSIKQTIITSLMYNVIGNGNGNICVQENNRNGNKCMVGIGMGIGMGLKLIGMERNGKAESHSCTPLMYSRFLT